MTPAQAAEGKALRKELEALAAVAEAATAARMQDHVADVARLRAEVNALKEEKTAVFRRCEHMVDDYKAQLARVAKER